MHVANADVVARARVMLFDVERVSAERLVGIYRVLGEVDGPAHYARRLAVVLHTTGHIFARNGAEMGLALGRLTEAIELCRGLDPVEHRDRDAVLAGMLTTHQWALDRCGRHVEAHAVRCESLVLARAGTGDRWDLGEALLAVAVWLVQGGRDDEAEPLFAEAAGVAVGLRPRYRPNAGRRQPAYAKALDHVRTLAAADPAPGTPALVRALTDHALTDHALADHALLSTGAGRIGNGGADPK
ncbi:hypothetical protein [Embleya sp. AB8]|uniref:hypothetical protein n=1 Tax=Embleya sp. AB8 TaxID=3156304 RepID=UPI003C75D02E